MTSSTHPSIAIIEPGRFLVTLLREVIPLAGEEREFKIGSDAPR